MKRSCSVKGATFDVLVTMLETYSICAASIVNDVEGLNVENKIKKEIINFYTKP
jgi:hypothetical protein